MAIENKEREAIAGSPQHSLMSFAGALAVALAIGVAVFDATTWIELNVSVLYSLPLVFAAAARKRRLLWTLALALTVMTFVVYVSQMPLSAAPLARKSFFIDRVLSALSVLLSAGILDAWLRSLQVRDRQGQAIEQQNGRLEAINNELRAHKKQISTKNDELERARHEIEEISRRKTQMLASISHDLRSPIQAITLMAEVIQRAAEKPDQVRKIPALAKRLQANAISVVDFLAEVIDIASFDTGRITVRESEFTIDELIAVQCQRVLPIAESKGLGLATSPCNMRLRTDRAKLGRIIGNLVGNAIKFTSTGSVTVSCGVAPDGRVFVRISDTGRGMKPEDLQRIFTEFAQTEQSHAQSGSGWGLGLAISRRMARLLKGDIEVQSELGKGSAFTVFLPPSSLLARKGGAPKLFPGAAA
jgi:signal transduction histidine kinase